MTYTVQELALQYAEKLVAYHEAQKSDWSDKERQVRRTVTKCTLHKTL
jgi:hypothetical protein